LVDHLVTFIACEIVTGAVRATRLTEILGNIPGRIWVWMVELIWRRSAGLCTYVALRQRLDGKA
jgi:hypothetical protein